MTDPTTIVYCEVCQLPHQRSASVCDDCGHALGTTPDWTALKAIVASLRRQIAVGAAVVLGMLALNVVFFGGAGYIIYAPPLMWTVFNAYRYRVLSKRVAHATTSGSR